MLHWLRRRRGNSSVTTVTGNTLEHGSPYIVPATAGEENRLDFQHQMLYRAIGKNYGAPLTQPQKMLDVGCGTGRWVVEMAIRFPQANVVGIDITPVNVSQLIQPLNPPPENFTLLQHDILTGLPFSANWFDYVHQRFLSAALPEQHWPKVIDEIIRVTRPKGWIELGEFGPPVARSGAAFVQLWNTWVALSATRGIDLNAGSKISERLATSGLRNITVQTVRFPIGDHGGRFGHAFSMDLLALGRALRNGVIRQHIIAEGDYDMLYARTQEELSNTSDGAFQPIFLAWGQKL